MEMIPFEKIHEKDFSIHHVFSRKQKWHTGAFYSYADMPRKFHGFLLLNGCTAAVRTNTGAIINAKDGDLLYIPKSVMYKITFKNISENDFNAYLVNFDMDNCRGDEVAFAQDVTVVCENSAYSITESMYSLANEYESIDSSTVKMKMYLLSVLNDIGELHKTMVNPSKAKEYSIISKGIKYIEDNINGYINVSAAAKLCSITPSCFRRLFKKYSGCSPKEYVLNKKLQKSKQLLKSGLYSVNEISELLGFTSPSYFSRLFKEKTGYSPSSYADKRNVN